MPDETTHNGDRDSRSVLLEVDYWGLLLDDLRAINSALLDCANAAAQVPLSILELILAPDSPQAAELAGAYVKRTLAAIGYAQEPLDRIVSLTEGRLVAIRTEAGLAPHAPDEQ